MRPSRPARAPDWRVEGLARAAAWSVVIYHVVYPHEGFAESARTLFRLVRRAQWVKPGRNRKLFLDIEGHRNSDGGFDADMLELQNVLG